MSLMNVRVFHVGERRITGSAAVSSVSFVVSSLNSNFHVEKACKSELSLKMVQNIAQECEICGNFRNKS